MCYNGIVELDSDMVKHYILKYKEPLDMDNLPEPLLLPFRLVLGDNLFYGDNDWFVDGCLPYILDGEAVIFVRVR